MPFEKGNQLAKLAKNPGRKVYELEQKQLDKMKRLLDKDLLIAEKFQNSKELSPLEEKKLQILQARILKYADKLHASKTDMELSGEITKKIVSVDE